MSEPRKLDVAALLTEVGVDPSNAHPGRSVGEHSRAAAALAPESRWSVDRSDLEMGGLLGEGATTAVYLAVQRSMRRRVAVRTVHPTRKTPAAPRQVLASALMLGAFEHPNILPVYGVAAEPDGTPLVIMKAIEATPWMDVLETPGHPLGCPSHREPIEFNIRRLIDVCGALEHAHFRGVIHRDVKPENVLVGRDGTVYLHGWDLAVAIRDDPTGRFPLAREQTQLAGTPAYMAPEMARVDATALGVATDVYLVGATLHDVVTGKPRHLGENVFDAFYSAVASTPFDYDPDHVPTELALILNKAMAADPARRFVDVAELRRALEAFLRHRPSERLTRHAVTAHEEFARALVAGADDYIVRELFATAYTAYGSARHFWSRNPTVTEGLERCIKEMIEYELRNGSPERARDLLGRLMTPDPALAARIDDPGEYRTVKRAEALVPRNIPAQPDPESARARLALEGTVVATWTLFGWGLGLAQSLGLPVDTVAAAVAAAVAWAVIAVLSILLGRHVMRPGALRLLIGPIGAVMLASAAILFGMGSSVALPALVAYHLLVFLVATAMLAATVDGRFVASAAFYLLGYLLASQVPGLAFWALGSANLLGLGSAALVIEKRLRREE